MIDFKHYVKVAFVGIVFRTKGKHNKHVYIKLIYIYIYIYGCREGFRAYQGFRGVPLKDFHNMASTLPLNNLSRPLYRINPRGTSLKPFEFRV